MKIGIDRIADIFAELKALEVDRNKNAIAVLMRIILEMSADEYMDVSGIDRKKGTPPHNKDKTLAEKVGNCCDHLISASIPFAYVNRMALRVLG